MRAKKADDLSWDVMKVVLWINGIFFIIGQIVKLFAQ